MVDKEQHRDNVRRHGVPPRLRQNRSACFLEQLYYLELYRCCSEIALRKGVMQGENLGGMTSSPYGERGSRHLRQGSPRWPSSRTEHDAQLGLMLAAPGRPSWASVQIT